MVFYGKYAFQSTNPTGPKKFLTSSSSMGETYPLVSASSVTEFERWILYQNTGGVSLTVEMGQLYYLKAIDVVGWVVGTRVVGDASAMRIVHQGDGLVMFQIFAGDPAEWQPIRYSVNVQLPYLIFPINGSMELINGSMELETGDETFYTFAQQLITPSLAVIQSSKNAQGYDFRNVDLSQADFNGVDCTGADFTGANLDGAQFQGATLTDAIFIGASLNQTNFGGAKSLDGAFFSGTDVSNVQWGMAISARSAHFDGATGIGCQIGSGFQPTQHADFSHADFTGADFTGSDFSYAKLIEAKMIRGVFVGAIFGGADLTAAQLGGLDKSAAAKFSYAYMPNVIFSKANLFGVSFAFATVFGAATRISDAATMEQCDFSNAYLEGIDLTGATLLGAKFNNACLVAVNLTLAQLSPTLSGSVVSSLAGACLQGTIFTQSNLTNADLTNATVAFTRGSLNVRYCNPLVEGPFPPPPEFEPLNYSPTQGLDLTTMSAETVCPNGSTVQANQARGLSLMQMLTSPSPATQWVPVGCFSSAMDMEKRGRSGVTIFRSTS